MGAYQLPALPQGIQIYLLISIALVISSLMSMLRSVLDVCLSSSETLSATHVALDFNHFFPATRFDSVPGFKELGEHDCSICLTQLQPQSEINHLWCGHMFHKVCLEKWFNQCNCNMACPLCRVSFIPHLEASWVS